LLRRTGPDATEEVELPIEGDRLDELLYVGQTRATTELVVIAPQELALRLA
jgi:hypothetical protein